jgi:hypothetical protein
MLMVVVMGSSPIGPMCVKEPGNIIMRGDLPAVPSVVRDARAEKRLLRD